MNGDCQTARCETRADALSEESLLPKKVGTRICAWWQEAIEACGAFEWVALSYLWISGAMIAAFHRNLANAPLHLGLRVLITAGILWICRSTQVRPGKVLKFVRHWYPQALFLFFFEEMHHIVHLIFPGWFDRYLIAFDFHLVGVNPTVWLEQFARPWLNDFMQMAYLTYFFHLIVLGAILYARDEEQAFWSVMTAYLSAYSIGYLIALVFPIESPYHSLRALHTVELNGGFFTSLMGLIERFGRVHGAAFPSLHVSGSFVAVLGAWRYRRWLFWVYLPCFVCMMVSTVYGRYHYIADVLAGLVTGAMGYWLGEKVMRLRSRYAMGG